MPLSTTLFIIAKVIGLIGVILVTGFTVWGTIEKNNEQELSKVTSNQEKKKTDAKLDAIIDVNTNPDPAAQIIIRERTQSYEQARKRRKALKSENIDDKINAVEDEYNAQKVKKQAEAASIPDRVTALRKVMDPIMTLAIAETQDKITELEATGYVKNIGVQEVENWKGVSVWQILPPKGGYAKNGEKFRPAIEAGYLTIEFAWKYGSQKDRFLIAPMNFPDGTIGQRYTTSGNILGINFSENSFGNIKIESLNSEESMNAVIDLIRSSINAKVEKGIENMAEAKARGAEANW